MALHPGAPRDPARWRLAGASRSVPAGRAVGSRADLRRRL